MPRLSQPSPLPPIPEPAPVTAPTAAATELDDSQARQLLKALGDPLRLQVIQALAQGERCVCDLTTDLDLSQSRLSFHLKVLKDAGLLSDRQRGRWIYYQLKPEALEGLRCWLAQLQERCLLPAEPCP